MAIIKLNNQSFNIVREGETFRIGEKTITKCTKKHNDTESIQNNRIPTPNLKTEKNLS